MLDKVIYTIEKYSMLKEKDGIVAGFSGGPDSTAMLHCLWMLREKYNLRITAVHLNHMIRGDEALRDENFARSFAEEHDINFVSERIKVEKYAEENGLSSEEAGRVLRYRLFDRVAEETNSSKIALAHNLNDQAETVMMRMLRGSGLTGLGGIKPVRDGKYIRPLIYCSRKEIERYCSAYDLRPVIDSTNKESIYARNRIRLELLPYIEKNYSRNFSVNLSKTAELFREEDEYMNAEAEKILGEHFSREDESIECSTIKELHTAMRRRVIRLIVGYVKGDLIGIEYRHIEDCIELALKNETGKKINLPGDLICKVEYGRLSITKSVKETAHFEHRLSLGCSIRLEESGVKVYTELVDSDGFSGKDTAAVKYFDHEKLPENVCVRNRRPGDYIYPKGMSGKKKVKDILIDKKIPREKRDNIPVIAAGSEVLWIKGVHDTGNFKPDDGTRKILKIGFEGCVNG